MSRIRGRGNKDTEIALPPSPSPWRTRVKLLLGSEPAEVELVAGDTKIFDDIGNNAARHVTGVPGKCDDAVGAKRIGVVAVAAGIAQMFAANVPESSLELPAIVGRIFARESRGEDEFVAESWRDGTACFQQRFQMRLGGLLKVKKGFAPVASVRVAAGQQVGLGNPHAIFISSNLHLRKRNDHRAETITRPAAVVKGTFDA
jgi:hypothetical protein